MKILRCFTVVVLIFQARSGLTGRNFSPARQREKNSTVALALARHIPVERGPVVKIKKKKNTKKTRAGKTEKNRYRCTPVFIAPALFGVARVYAVE